jgi:hypothetical protein
MSHTAYQLALIRRDDLLREAADRRLATAESASLVERAGGGSATRLLRGRWRSAHVYVTLIAKVREVRNEQ